MFTRRSVLLMFYFLGELTLCTDFAGGRMRRCICSHTCQCLAPSVSLTFNRLLVIFLSLTAFSCPGWNSTGALSSTGDSRMYRSFSEREESFGMYLRGFC